MTKKNECVMTYMHPSYEAIEVPGNDSPYGLVRYTGDRMRSENKLFQSAIVFVPGHKGDVYQVRSLGSHVRRLGYSLEVYALDILEEPSALHAGLLWQQARFAALAVSHVASRHPDAPNVLMVGHSLGGLVIRTALILPSFPAGRVSTVVTLGTPHQAPPLYLDRSLTTFYQQLNRRFWRTSLPKSVPPPPPKTPEVKRADEAESSWSWLTKLFASSNVTEVDGLVVGNETSTLKNVAVEANTGFSGPSSTATVCPAGDDTCLPVEAEGTSPPLGEQTPAGSSLPSPPPPAALAAGRKQRAAQAAEKARLDRTRRLAFSNARLANVTVVSISGGDTHDAVVPHELTLLDGVVPPTQSWSVSVGPGTSGAWGAAGDGGGGEGMLGFGVDHLALVWCFQLQDALARSLGAVAALDLEALKGGGERVLHASASPTDRLAAIKAEFLRTSPHSSEAGTPSDSGTAEEDATDELVRSPTEMLPVVEWLASLPLYLRAAALDLASYRTAVGLVVSLWTMVAILSVGAVLSHALADAVVASAAATAASPSTPHAPGSTLPPPAALVESSWLHWPCLLVLDPAARGASRWVKSLPTWARAAVAASVGAFLLSTFLQYMHWDLEATLLDWELRWFEVAETAAAATAESSASADNSPGSFSSPPADEGEDDSGTTAESVPWYSAVASSVASKALALFSAETAAWVAWSFLQAAVTLLRLLLVHAFAALSSPTGAVVHLCRGATRTVAGPAVVYGALLVLMGACVEVLAAVQRACVAVLASRAVAVFGSGVSALVSPFGVALGVASKLACGVGTGFAKLRGALRAVLSYIPVVGKWVGGSSSEAATKSGDDLREEFRNRRAANKASSSSSSFSSSSAAASRNWVSLVLSPAEQKLACALLLAWVGMHVKFGVQQHQPPVRLVGLLSLDRSFAQELAVATAFACVACAGLLLSLVVLPQRDPELRKYHLLLAVLYAPLVPLSAGAWTHAWGCLLSRPAAGAALAYSNAAALTFDGVCDCALLLCCACHLFLARFRAFPLPAPLTGAEELWEVQEVTAGTGGASKGKAAETSMVVRRPMDHSQLPNAPVLAKVLPKGCGGEWAAGSVSESAGGEAGVVGGGGGGAVDARELVVVTSGSGEEAVWRKRYNWRTGLTYYEKEGTGELCYPDGGPKAVFEETSVDSQGAECRVARDVTIGPCFAVVGEPRTGSAEAFAELWGHKFARTTRERATAAAASSSAKRSQYASGGPRGARNPAVVVERVVGEALERGDFYLVLGVYALAGFVATAGVLAGVTYHGLTALGVTAGVFSARHLSRPPAL